MNLYSQNADSIGNRIGINTNKFKYILETIYQNYLDTVDIDYISETAFQNMLKTLDKNSLYFNKEQLYGRQVQTEGTEIGIGLDIRIIDGNVIVYSVTANSPADSAGIKPCDKIIEIDSMVLYGKGFEEINKIFRGERNSFVNLKIEKALSEEIRQLNLLRKDIKVSSLNISLMIPESKILFISSRNFSKISHAEFKEVFEKYKKQKIKGILIDLRDNPGGYLEQVSLIIDEFLKEYKTISYTEARVAKYQSKLISTKGGCCEDLPLVLILNKKSASACELFAGVLQDYDRGIVIGQRSFGKSSVQLLWTMNDSTGFQITVAEYFTPLGRSVDIKKKDSVIIDPAGKLSMDENAYNKLTEFVNQMGYTSNLPVSYSENGRTILGGGGIFPDYLLEEEQYTLLTNILLQRNIIFEYVYRYLSVYKKSLEEDFKNEPEKFIKDFKISDKMLFDLKSLSYKKNLWNEEMFLKDKTKIGDFVKAEIGRVLFGDKAYYGILIKSDKWIQKALEVFPESDIINK